MGSTHAAFAGAGEKHAKLTKPKLLDLIVLVGAASEMADFKQIETFF